MIALHLLTRDHAEKAGLILDGPVSEICKKAGVNRTQVYEKKSQLTKALEKVELPQPGRSPVPSASESCSDVAGWALQVAVLQYRIDNPGAVCPPSRWANRVQPRLQAVHPRSIR